MRSSSLLSVCVLGSLLAAACGGDGDGGTANNPSGNKGGSSANKGGSAGAAGGGGKAGTGATAGAAGTAAAAGKSGSTGGGAAGSAGSVATGGSAGTSASAGSAGATSAGASGATSKGGTGGTAGTGGASGTGGTNGAGTGGTAGTTQGPCAVPTSLTLSPPAINIVVENNVSTPVPVKVTGICPDGTTTSPSATFGIDHFNVATVSTGGAVTGSTEQGGEATLTVTSGGVTATAKVTVIVKKKLEEVTVTDPDKTKLDTPSADGTMKVVYPYDRTMFARGLFAPELMWNADTASDVCAVTFKEDFFEATAYVAGPQPGRWLLNEKIWEGITASNHGEDVYVNLACLHGGIASSAPEMTWRVAQGSLRGSITYWAVNKGQIMKVSPSAPEAQPLFDPGSPADVGSPEPVGYVPPATGTPWTSNDSGKRCVACHTVSKNGARVAAVFSSEQGGNPWGVIDQTGGTPTVKSIGKYYQYARFQALSPDGKFDVVNSIPNPSATTLSLVDPDTGLGLSSALDTFTDYTGAPAFANDGSKIAFPGHANGADAVEYGRSTLDIMAFDPNNAAAGYFTDRKTIRPDDGGCYAFPSFSPASDFVVYQKGDYARANHPHAANDALYVTDINGASGDIRLGLGSGDHLDARQHNRAYQPTVNPIAVGGYMWVVFVSPRDYGNRKVTTGDPYTNNKQLWVTAVDLDPKPGVDPSHPAFRLSGQNLDTINMSGYWSLDACHQNGDTCEAGYDCCGGYCRPDGTGKQVCADGTGTCAKLDEKCVTTADCCTGGASSLKCVGGFCAAGGKD